MAETLSLVIVCIQAAIAAGLMAFGILRLDGQPFDGALMFLMVFLFTLAQMTFMVRMGIDLPVNILRGLYSGAVKAGLIKHLLKFRQQFGTTQTHHSDSIHKSPPATPHSKAKHTTKTKAPVQHEQSATKHHKSSTKHHETFVSHSQSKSQIKHQELQSSVSSAELNSKMDELHMQNTRTMREQPAFMTATLCLILGLGFLGWDIVNNIREGRPLLSTEKLAVLGLLMIVFAVEAALYYLVAKRCLYLTQSELIKYLVQSALHETMQQLKQIWNKDPWKQQANVESYADQLLETHVNFSDNRVYKKLRSSQQQLLNQLKKSWPHVLKLVTEIQHAGHSDKNRVHEAFLQAIQKSNPAAYDTVFRLLQTEKELSKTELHLQQQVRHRLLDGLRNSMVSVSNETKVKGADRSTAKHSFKKTLSQGWLPLVLLIIAIAVAAYSAFRMYQDEQYVQLVVLSVALVFMIQFHISFMSSVNTPGTFATLLSPANQKFLARAMMP